jgi:plasmid stabilization system protein ParE
VKRVVRTTAEADAQIRTIDAWWRINRPAASTLFAGELTASLDTIGHAPQIGRRYRKSPVVGVRRVLLKHSRYHLYYVERDDEVMVLAVWHARRGVGPPMRT